MFTMRNGRQKPTEPGNDSGLYEGGLGRMKIGNEKYDARNEVFGRRLAKFSLALAVVVHFVFFPIFYFSELSAHSWSISDEFIGNATFIVLFFCFIIVSSRAIANKLTSGEDEMSYRAVVLYILGCCVQFVVCVILVSVLPHT